MRLLAALQVAHYHVLEILQVHPPEFLRSILRASFLFPGVPVFFFISGFLISKSYESNHRLGEYSQNRILRLYPALIVCVGLSFVFVFVSGYAATVDVSPGDWVLLYLAKTTIFQFYNPDFMRAYGDGVINGSLWTITVELQFYVLVPIIYAVLKLQGTSAQVNIRLLCLIAVFIVANRLFTYSPHEYYQEVWFKLVRVSFLPWFYMFLIGMFVQKNFDFFYRLLAGRFLYILVLYVVAAYYALNNNIALGNNINPVLYLLLAALAFSFAYSFVGLSRKLLRGNDISYGAYIYHMPVVNFMLYSGYTGEVKYAYAALGIALLLSLASWMLVEKNSLKLKRHPLNPVNRKMD